MFGNVNATDELAECNLFYFAVDNRFFDKSFNLVPSSAFFALFMILSSTYFLEVLILTRHLGKVDDYLVDFLFNPQKFDCPFSFIFLLYHSLIARHCHLA